MREQGKKPGVGAVSGSGLMLGIDLGTSGVKAAVFTSEGLLLGIDRSPYSVDSPRPGWAQTDPEKWWRGTCEAIRGACGSAGISPSEIAAVGLSVLFPAVMPVDRTGKALHPAILYSDQRSVAEVRAIEAVIPRGEYQSLTGNMLAPGNCAAASILWLRSHAPEAFAGSRVAWANTFLLHRLTGSFATDPSMVSLSGLADVRDPLRWSDGLCGRLGIALEALPEIRGSAEAAGAVCEAAHTETGLRVGVPVACGCGDTPASTFGAGARSPGDVVYSAGSTDCVTTLLSHPSRDPRWVTCAFPAGPPWCAIGTTTSSGASVAWFCREILASEGPGGREQLSLLAGRSPPGANGLLFLPYLQGERTPLWDPRARGTFFGLSAATSRADMARAVLEGTALGLRAVIDGLPEVGGDKSGDASGELAGDAAGPIRLVGGGAADGLWNRIKADALGRALAVSSFQETGVLGAALLGGIGAGVVGSFVEASRIAGSRGTPTTVEPDPEAARLYGELYGLFRDLYDRSKEIAHSLADRGGA